MALMKMISPFVIVAVFPIVSAVVQEYNVSVCATNSGYFDYEGRETATRTWKLDGSNCTFDRSALLLNLTKMDVWDCKPKISISSFLSGDNICQYSEGTCFFLTTNKSTFHPLLVSGCRVPIWIVSSKIFPITVSFQRSGSSKTYTFNMSYIYITNEEFTTAAETSSVSTSAVNIATSTSLLQYESTASNNQNQNQTGLLPTSDSQSATTVALGILLALMTGIALILLLLVRKYWKKLHGSLKMENALTLQFPERTSDVILDNVYHEVGANNAAREVVDNQLYGSA